VVCGGWYVVELLSMLGCLVGRVARYVVLPTTPVTSCTGLVKNPSV